MSPRSDTPEVLVVVANDFAAAVECGYIQVEPFGTLDEPQQGADDALLVEDGSGFEQRAQHDDIRDFGRAEAVGNFREGAREDAHVAANAIVGRPRAVVEGDAAGLDGGE